SPLRRRLATGVWTGIVLRLGVEPRLAGTLPSRLDVAPGRLGCPGARTLDRAVGRRDRGHGGIPSPPTPRPQRAPVTREARAQTEVCLEGQHIRALFESLHDPARVVSGESVPDDGGDR